MNNIDYQHLLKSRVWRRMRREYLAAHPLCERCEAHGVTRLASEVHHRIPVETAGDYAAMRRLAYDVTNLQALCQTCHREVHETGDFAARYRRRRPKAEVQALARKHAKETITNLLSND